MCIQLQNSPILQFCSLSPLIIFSPLIDLRGTIQSFVYASILFAGIRTGTRLFTLFIKYCIYSLFIGFIFFTFLPFPQNVMTSLFCCCWNQFTMCCHQWAKGSFIHALILKFYFTFFQCADKQTMSRIWQGFVSGSIVKTDKTLSH